MYGFEFYKFKLALERVEEENFLKLQEEVKKVRCFIEKALAAMLESTSSVARTKYAGLEMY